MKVILRADAGVGIGTGHVMRCLTVAEELTARHHDVVLHGSLGDVDWLAERVRAMGVPHLDVAPEALDAEQIAAARPDVVVIDSYRIDAESIARLDAVVPVVAVVDGDDRGIRATAYLDPNLGAERAPYPPLVAERMWAGSGFALVRRELTALRRADGWRLPEAPTLLCVMGGSDPFGTMPRVAASLVGLPPRVRLVLVTAPAWMPDVRALVAGRPGTSVIEPTAELASLFAHADLVVSASGTTAWDVCTLGLPAVFVAIVDNQRSGLRGIVDADVAVGLDAIDDTSRLDTLSGAVEALLADEGLRRRQTVRCRALFDGRGAERVVDALEELVGSR